MKKIALYHLLPIATAIGLVTLFIILMAPKSNGIVNHTITGEQYRQKGIMTNYAYGKQDESDLIASLKNKEQLTIFGSSEFADTPYGTYNFLPDSLGIPVLGIGHAYHQELSMLCELLAAKKYLKRSKICIVLSPGWFTNDTPELDGGTNIEAFLEFVPQHFINNIAYDKNIDQKYKLHVGAFIDRNYAKINAPTFCMNQLRDNYNAPQNSGFQNAQNTIKSLIYGTKTPLASIFNYQISLKPNKFAAKWNKNWDALSEQALNEFKLVSSKNKIYVLDDYYQANLVQKDGSILHPKIEKLDLKNCREFKDFKLLVELLKENEVDCSFIIQPLNPYYYRNLENNNELWKSVTQILDKNKFPYLNLHTDNKKDYEPGTLRDVMHLGDFGWMKVNRFIYSTYYE